MHSISIGEETIPVRPSAEHVYLLETALVAKGYGVSKDVVKKHKMRNGAELVEGKHWIRGVTNCTHPGDESDTIYWTKRGIVRLGFFIKSGRAKIFRDAAEDLVIEAASAPARGIPANYPEALRALADLAAKGAAAASAAKILYPREPFGAPSKVTGLPKTRLIPAYYRTGAPDGNTVAFLTAEQQLQFAFWVVEESA